MEVIEKTGTKKVKMTRTMQNFLVRHINMPEVSNLKGAETLKQELPDNPYEKGQSPERTTFDLDKSERLAVVRMIEKFANRVYIGKGGYAANFVTTAIAFAEALAKEDGVKFTPVEKTDDNSEEPIYPELAVSQPTEKQEKVKTPKPKAAKKEQPDAPEKGKKDAVEMKAILKLMKEAEEQGEVKLPNGDLLIDHQTKSPDVEVPRFQVTDGKGAGFRNADYTKTVSHLKQILNK